MTGPLSKQRLTSSTRSGGGFWVAAQFTSPFLFAVFIAMAIWGGYQPKSDSPDAMFWHLIICGSAALIYLAIQGFAVVLQPVGSDVRPLLDVLASLVPMLVIAFAVERAVSGYLPLNNYQMGVLWLCGLAALIDLTCFTLFAMKVNRLAPDVVVTN